MSYQLKIDEKSSKSGRFISRTHRALQNAFVESGLKQQQLADSIGCDKSRIHRVLAGGENLTLRTIAELAWALGYRPEIKLVKISDNMQGNIRQNDKVDNFISNRTSSTTVSVASTVTTVKYSESSANMAVKTYEYLDA